MEQLTRFVVEFSMVEKKIDNFLQVSCLCN